MSVYICCSYSDWLPLKAGVWILNPPSLSLLLRPWTGGPSEGTFLYSSDVNATSSVVFRQAWCELSKLISFFSFSWTLTWTVACSLWSSERWWMKGMVSMGCAPWVFFLLSLRLCDSFRTGLLLQWWKHFACSKGLGTLSRMKIFQELILTSLY